MIEPHLYQVEYGWIEVRSGRKFFFERPDPSSILIEDIAGSLSTKCRYNGHVKRGLWYSVAEHCVVMTRWAREHYGVAPAQRDLRAVLMHDASEAYYPDVPRPVKHKMPDFQRMEHALDGHLASRFDIPFPKAKWIKDLDTRILVDERAQVMNPSKHDWGTDGLEPLGIELPCWEPMRAEDEFLLEYERVRED